jgi:hypothetical protein
MRFKETTKVPGLVVRVLADGDIEVDASRVPSSDPPGEVTPPAPDNRIQAVVARDGSTWLAMAVEVKVQARGETAFQAVQYLRDELLEVWGQGCRFKAEHRRAFSDERELTRRLKTLRFYVKLDLAPPHFLRAFVNFGE